MTKKWKARLRFLVIGVAGGIGAILWWSPWEFNLFPPPIPPEKPTLLNVKQAFPPGVRGTVVTAHPDDAEFYMGGTLPQLKAAAAVNFPERVHRHPPRLEGFSLCPRCASNDPGLPRMRCFERL